MTVAWRRNAAPVPGCLLAAVLLWMAMAGAAAAQSTRIEGGLEQGGVAIGRTLPGAAILLDGQPIRVSPEGAFVFGFGREQPGEARLDVRYKDGKAESMLLQVRPRQYDIQRIDGLPERMVTPPPAVLSRIRDDAAKVKAARTFDTPATWFLEGFIWPSEGTISGVYGSQRVLNGQPKAPHYGVDVAAASGAPLVAPAGGVVRLAERDLYYTGGTVILDHGHGLSSVFLHMSTVAVSVGQTLRQGEHLGTVGATGRATGPHLHWGMTWFEVRVDPRPLARPAR